MSWDAAPVQSFACLPSTMQTARAWAAAGAVEGSTVVARQQTAGCGRHGRLWHSPADGGLWMTLILRPAQPDPALALVAGLATWRAVVQSGAAAAQLKWPNDVLVGQRKLAGILLQTDGWERASAAEGGAGTAAKADGSVLVGIGINLAPMCADAPASVAPRHISLREVTDTPPSAAALLEAVRHHLQQAYELWQRAGMAPIVAAWQSAHSLHGAWVRAEGPSPGSTVEGEVCGLGSQGALCLRTAGGAIVEICAGEVVRLHRA